MTRHAPCVHRVSVPSQVMTITSTVAFNKDAFPSANAVGELSFSLSIQALCSCVGLQAQYQAFVRLRPSEAAPALYKPSRSTGPAFWNLLPGEALTLRELAVARTTTGPAPMLWAKRSRSRGIFQVVFVSHPAFYGGIFRPETALGMPARSIVCGRSTVSPAAVIKSSMSPLWPRPASTTRVPPGLSNRTACGTKAR